MSHVMAVLGVVPFTRPELASHVEPLIHPQMVIPCTELVFKKTGN
jgi:hypothetical protein